MKYKYRKELVVAIIVLFIVISVIQSTGRSIFDDDTTPPVTTHTLNPQEPDGDNGWYVSNVNVTLNATDDMSGVNAIYYNINSGHWNNYTSPFTVANTRHYKIRYYSVDNAGNVENIKLVEFMIDNEPPSVTLFYERLKKPNGLKFTAECHDFISGIDRVEFCTIEDELMSIDYDEPYEWVWIFKSIGIVATSYRLGPEHGIMAVAYDNAGNSAYDLIEIIPSVPFSIIGIIYHPEFSEEEVTFIALIAISNYGCIHLFEHLTFPNDYEGYVGRFFINAKFYNI